MKYKNANDVLPEELLVLVQEYIQGEYIYVPVKEKQIADSLPTIKQSWKNVMRTFIRNIWKE